MFKLFVDADDFNKQLKVLETSLVTTVRDVEIPQYFQQLQSIAADAVALARIQIKLATTETGRARGKGSAGRVETGKFIEGIKWEGRRRGKGLYEIRIGWLDGQPDWATYQELGFKHRGGMYVTGADALGTAQRYFEAELGKLRSK